MKSPIGNQKGLALVTTLVMMMLALGVVAILLMLTTRATRLTGVQQRYTDALSASKAGASLFINTVLNCTAAHVCTPPPLPSLSNPNQNCLNTKLYNNWSNWTSANCSASNQVADPETDYDLSWPAGQYTVYVEVVDTYTFSQAITGDPSCSSTAGCYFYTVMVTAVGPSGEKATTEFVYQNPIQ